MPALTRFDSACIVLDDDQYFANPVWIDQIISGKGYSYETLSIESLNGEQIATGLKHQLELKFLDATGISTLRSWMALGKRVWVYAYGPGGSLFWMNSSLFQLAENPESGNGKPMGYTLSMSESGWLNIRSGVNLLFPLLARGESVAEFNVVSNGTILSATKNAGFSAANSPVHKLVQTAPGQTYVNTTAAYRFPIRQGMVFSLYAKTYLYGQTSGYNRKVGIKCLDGVPTQTELVMVTDATVGSSTLTGQLTISNANSKFGTLYYELNNTGSTATAEIDEVVLSYGNNIPSSFTEG